jgi:hypothetical protein
MILGRPRGYWAAPCLKTSKKQVKNKRKGKQVHKKVPFCNFTLFKKVKTSKASPKKHGSESTLRSNV